jgi:probable addiction module antidote protein
MSKIADDAGRGRESLYKSLSQGGNPSFETVLKVLASLGFRLSPRLNNVA